MATIKEVAHRARVSVGTVSNVLGGAVFVSKPLKDRVMEVIKQLDYHPDHMARSLKSRKTRTIGLVLNDITDPFFPQIMRGAEDAAWSANYILITFNSDNQPQREEKALDALRSRRVDGILLVAARDTDPERLRAIQVAGTPLVCLEREVPGAGLDSVLIDNFRAARDCVRHLTANGYSRIGLLNSDQAVTVARDRQAGYRQGLEEAHLGYEDGLVAIAGTRENDAIEAARRLLAGAPRPFAVIAASARLGVALLRVAREMHLRCPQDLAIAVFDDPAFSEAFTPPLTTVARPSYELGQKGVELLLKRIEEPHRRRTRLVLETTLRVRESCGASLEHSP